MGEDVDVADSGVEAIADRDVDKPVFAAERDSGFGAIFGQGEEPFAGAPTHDDAERAIQSIAGAEGAVGGHDEEWVA